MLSAKKEFLRILQKLWDNCKINVQKSVKETDGKSESEENNFNSYHINKILASVIDLDLSKKKYEKLRVHNLW